MLSKKDTKLCVNFHFYPKTNLHSDRIGFIERSRKGSHVKMRHADGRIIVFPCHKEIDPYTLKGALKDADIDITLFLKNVR